MTEKAKTLIRAVPKLDILKALYDRAANLSVVSVREDELAELKVALHLLEGIDWTPVTTPTKGLHCPGCEREIAAPRDGAIQALPLCWRCMALQNIVAWTEHNPTELSVTSLRFHGHHYACTNVASLDDPVMTITLHQGERIVTTALRYQGPVPKAYREILKDNCVIVQGNPEGLPLGVTP